MSAAAVRLAWSATEPAEKCRLTAALKPLEAVPQVLDLEQSPGRPAQPELVHPSAVPKRGLGQPAGRAALLHAVAHIEFNAINLALDAVLRFGPEMPLAFSQDWLSVAQDEARHYLMLEQRLQAHGLAYGDLSAHNGLWEAAEKTAHDVLARMALVPRVLEARGLDVTPGMISRLRAVGATAEVQVLEQILAEEVRHVQIGTYWYSSLCAQRGLDRVRTFHQLLAELMPGRVPVGPFNEQARAEAGFLPEEYRF